MDSKTNDHSLLEREREKLHNLIDKRGEEPLSNDSLVEQSRKLDGIITPIQKEQRQRP